MSGLSRDDCSVSGPSSDPLCRPDGSTWSASKTLDNASVRVDGDSISKSSGNESILRERARALFAGCGPCHYAA